MTAERPADKTLILSPLTVETLMVRRAQAEDSAAAMLQSAVRRDRELFLPLAEDAAREANDCDDALCQRFGYSPVGIGREWPASTPPASPNTEATQ